MSLSLVEWKVLEQLSYSQPAGTSFVVESVRGVLAGTPVSKSWQHRFLAPLLVVALGGASLAAVKRFAVIALLLANGLLFGLLWRRDGRGIAATLAVVALCIAHAALAYKLEYPWDGIDQLLFIAFGVAAASGTPFRKILPLLAIGVLNHETILYLPLFYVFSRDRRERLWAVGSGIIACAAIVAMRAIFYRGRPDLPGQVYEAALPAIDNHLHVAHNLRQLFVDDWTAGRAHIALGFLAAVVALVGTTARSASLDLRRAALWSLLVLGTILCFGYVNETRHYLLLAAFWIPFGFIHHQGARRVPVPMRVDK